MLCKLKKRVRTAAVVLVLGEKRKKRKLPEVFVWSGAGVLTASDHSRQGSNIFFGRMVGDEPLAAASSKLPNL